ncbi:hypothetical protein CAF53_23780 [Sphingobium sp. LB126]|uniref:MlaA family lipoprotein n=1 Tax=Sphingobium sp. LB126 TaxID=1983755 RepID=UPI000C1FF86B|nr:VacJ family lipoprotein [Sphingobium sp. LB126]PJG45717.1 hypothetical protein CAF53_23780 [Sphingobium sp. LB126]
MIPLLAVTLLAVYPPDPAPPTDTPTLPAQVDEAESTKPRGDDTPPQTPLPVESAPIAASPSSAPAPIATTALPNDSGTSQGDIVVTARPRGDPLQHLNAESFAVTQAVDDAIIGPAAHTYEHVVPKPVRGGLRNIFYNLHEPTVLLNYLVQLKPGKAVETLGRFVVNTTIGVVGIMDVAKNRPFNLPRRPNSFANSLGYYGVKPGPFLFLPLIGPTTIRDLFGGGVDRLLVPSLAGGQIGGITYVATTGSLKLLDRRLRLDNTLQTVRKGPGDPYATRRALYLATRQAEIDNLHSRRDENVAR